MVFLLPPGGIRQTERDPLRSSQRDSRRASHSATPRGLVVQCLFGPRAPPQPHETRRVRSQVHTRGLNWTSADRLCRCQAWEHQNNYPRGYAPCLDHFPVAHTGGGTSSGGGPLGVGWALCLGHVPASLPAGLSAGGVRDAKSPSQIMSRRGGRERGRPRRPRWWGGERDQPGLQLQPAPAPRSLPLYKPANRPV